MSINGKREDFTREDLLEVGKEMSIRKPAELVDRIVEVVSAWSEYAGVAGVEPAKANSIARAHRQLS